MVYPVSSPLQQTIPAANTFQPGGEAAQKPEENKIEDNTRPSGSDTARAESSETRNNGRTEDSRAYYAQQDDRYEDTGGISASSSRGTQLDITA